ncbi:MAG: ABC-F family ATP-binding cassette domain-containing protein [Muribaculaceae bacterium]|nr:ABC-F family ATP-binding cassette domain-containing protein [Muribaculaceae bacterium]
MKPLLLVDNLTKSYGDRLLFGDVTFGVSEGDKIGIIARNGTGKSTLLRLIAGGESPDSGTITFRSGVRVGFLSQLSVLDPSKSLMDNLLPVIPESGHDEWNREDRVRQMLSQLGVTDMSQSVDTLSGGQLKRVDLARLLLSAPDLLILDEPTNHLDISTVEWLENYLTRQRVTLLMVTHDRYFLDRVCSRIIEIDQRQIFTYDGNFDYYLRRRAEWLEAQDAELAKVKNTLRREQEWMRRQPQARAGKAKFRIDNFYELKRRASVSYDDRAIDPTDFRSSYIGSKIFEAEGISKRFGDKVILDGFSYTFARREKVGIVGENGVGKSTFIKMLQGLVPQDSGEWNVGETVRFGYYSQEGIDLPEGKKVIDAITDITDDIVLDGISRYTPMQFLTRFLFSPADQQKYISTLSGGERRRLNLAAVLVRQPNFLILDEPTNDLDIPTLAILEEYLREFKGCVIVISHDRHFLDSVVDHLFVMEGEGVIRDFPGSYSEYREWLKARRAAEAAEAAPRKEKPTRQRTADRPARLSFKERKELEALTTEIDVLTAEKADLESQFNTGAVKGDYAAAARRYEEVKNLLDDKEMRWLELSERE